MAQRYPAFILAGGGSLRFGSDKARALFEGKPLVLRVAETAHIAASSVTVVADVPNKYADLGLRTIADAQPGEGPLGGLRTALAAAPEADHILMLSCDLAGLDAAWLSLLCDADAHAQIVAFESRPLQTLVARYATALLPRVEERLTSGQRAMHRFVHQVGPMLLPPPDNWEQLCNVNYRADLGASEGQSPSA